ncbi:MAG: hypothetical protein EAZ42_06990 [Verrucomicrobia bacterium]|nr:MAG: hypothetical protein EAZ42_06990 [Verrucomicrobiota bacterium]
MSSLPYQFRDSERSIVITDPRLPQPWINYLSNGTLHAFVSQAGGGMCWWKSPLKNRITRYRQYNLPLDSPGYYIYLKGADGVVWSPSWRPVETPLDAWQAEHRPGLTRFTARRGDIEALLDLWIAPGENTMIWDLHLKNHGEQDQRMDVVGYVEFCLLDWKQDVDWACYVKNNLATAFDPEANAVTYLYRHFHFNPYLADCPLVYFGASEKVTSFDGDRDVFMGNYRDERNPIALENGACSNSEMLCGDPCAALQCELHIPSKSEKRMQFFLGGEPQAIVEWPRAQEAVKTTMARLRNAATIDRLRDELHAWWDRHLGVLDTALPDPDIARQINVWNPVQSVHTGRYSRSVSQHAAGVRTLGFRDTCQDMIAIAYRDPEWATSVFRYLISQQYEDGHTPHQCNPVEKTPAEPHIHIDNPLWLPMVAYAILAETGDFSLLDETEPWLSGDSLTPIGSATIWEHLVRIPDFMEANLGSHHIPLSHKGDWNDSIGKFSKKGKGESLFAAQQYCQILGMLEEFAKVRGEHETAARMVALRTKQADAILACAWDGSWWRRGFDDDGVAIGSNNCQYGKIWLNTQSWAVLADVGSEEQKRQAMDSVSKMLDTKLCGIAKLTPSFQSFPEALDPYSGYSPGCGENGAIFCHANTWAIMAEAMLGRADQAWHYYRQLVPHLALQSVGLDRYKAEPYAYVSNIIGPENPKFGWANVTQVTGTAAWMDIAATQYLLGIRPQLTGLKIAPSLPHDWPGYTATRIFRDCSVKIEVVGNGCKIAQVSCDGIEMDDSLVPASMIVGKSTCTIQVLMASI